MFEVSRLSACLSFVSFLIDPRLTRGCREQDAEEVTGKERANFCAYFKPRPDAYRPGGEARTQAARAKLGDLFGTGNNTDREPES